MCSVSFFFFWLCPWRIKILSPHQQPEPWTAVTVPDPYLMSHKETPAWISSLRSLLGSMVLTWKNLASLLFWDLTAVSPFNRSVLFIFPNELSQNASLTCQEYPSHMQVCYLRLIYWIFFQSIIFGYSDTFWISIPSKFSVSPGKLNEC